MPVGVTVVCRQCLDVGNPTEKSQGRAYARDRNAASLGLRAKSAIYDCLLIISDRGLVSWLVNIRPLTGSRQAGSGPNLGQVVAGCLGNNVQGNMFCSLQQR